MPENEYFKSALASFTHEAASGGAIRHLTDLGYTVDQIVERLTFPTPRERVRREVWERLVDTGVVLVEEPGSGRKRERADFVMEYDRYGRATFRKQPVQKEDEAPVAWRERRFEEKQVLLSSYLAAKCAENGEERSWCSCAFGLWSRREPGRLGAAMESCDRREREYVLGLPWEDRICYHRLDQRMRQIVAALCESGQYEGTLYFLKTRERVVVERKIELTKLCTGDMIHPISQKQ